MNKKLKSALMSRILKILLTGYWHGSALKLVVRSPWSRVFTVGRTPVNLIAEGSELLVISQARGKMQLADFQKR